MGGVGATVGMRIGASVGSAEATLVTIASRTARIATVRARRVAAVRDALASRRSNRLAGPARATCLVERARRPLSPVSAPIASTTLTANSSSAAALAAAAPRRNEPPRSPSAVIVRLLPARCVLAFEVACKSSATPCCVGGAGRCVIVEVLAWKKERNNQAKFT